MKKSFLQSKEVAHRLDVSRSQLQNLAAHIPYLYIESVKSRLWPESYVAAYVAYLRKAGLKAVVATAREFAATSVAKDLLDSARADFSAQLKSRTEFNTRQVAELFSVAESTVAGWRDKDALAAVAQKVETKRNRGKPPVYHFTYTQATLRKYAAWRNLPS